MSRPLVVAAIATCAIAAALWIAIVKTHGPESRAEAATARDAGAVTAIADAAGPDAYQLDGLPVDVDRGVKFVVPKPFVNERLDKGSITVAAPGIRIVIGATTRKQLATPLDGLVGMAKDDHGHVTAFTELDAHRTIGRYVGKDRSLNVLYVVEQPGYRVVVFAIFDAAHATAPGTERLLDEIQHDRLLLP